MKFVRSYLLIQLMFTSALSAQETVEPEEQEEVGEEITSLQDESAEQETVAKEEVKKEAAPETAAEPAGEEAAEEEALEEEESEQPVAPEERPQVETAVSTQPAPVLTPAPVAAPLQAVKPTQVQPVPGQAMPAVTTGPIHYIPIQLVPTAPISQPVEVPVSKLKETEEAPEELQEPEEAVSNEFQEPQEGSVEGPETIELEESAIGFRGNWVKKREWLLRAREEVEKIEKLEDEVKNLRVPIWERYKKIQDELDNFYKSSQERISRIETAYDIIILEPTEPQDQVQKEQPSWYRSLMLSFASSLRRLFGRAVAPVVAPRLDFEAEEKKERYKVAIESIKEEIKTASEFDSALTLRMDKLDEQIKISDEETARARQVYNEIWEIIDDTKARESFYALKSTTKRLRSIEEYILGPFGSDFEINVENAQKQMDKVSDMLKELEVGESSAS